MLYVSLIPTHLDAKIVDIHKEPTSENSIAIKDRTVSAMIKLTLSNAHRTRLISSLSALIALICSPSLTYAHDDPSDEDQQETTQPTVPTEHSEQEPNTPIDTWETDTEPYGEIDLLFADFDIVISASRSEQASNMTSVPVSILSADDIHYSGVSELPQLLAFIPGVDALQLDRNRWAIGVRGLHQTFSDRTLFLLNGRNASNPVHGGVDFQRLPIFLEDIQQIETVRGPGGAAWGANAFNGVINIIEKSPRDTTGVILSQRVSEQGDTKSNFRVGDASENFAWRFSGEYNNVRPSETPYEIIGLSSTPTNPKDFLRSQRFDFDGVYDFSDDTSIDFGIGGSHIERGDSPFLAVQLGLDERIDLIRSHAKLSHQFSPDANGYIQWYGTYQDVNRPSMYRYNSIDNNIDGQYSFSANPDHEITVGGSLRMIHLNITQPRITDSLPAGTSSEEWIGAFISDNWTINDQWTLESQFRIDWYSETMLDWSGRAAILHSLDGDDDHVFRFALAKAFRTPQTALRDLISERIPLGGGLFAVNLSPAGEIDNEQLYSIELGYNAKLKDGLTFRTDAYMQYYQDLTGVILLPEPAPVVGRQFFTIDNIGSAKAYGFETELKHQTEKTTVSIWYAYNDFDFDAVAQNARAFQPAKNKVGITARAKLTEWLTANANYRYTDTVKGDTTEPVDAFHRLDLTLTMAITDWNLELQVGALDVFDQTDIAIFDQTATSVGQETPGRSAFAQLRFEF